MPLTAGERLGPYEILALIGAGGMGEVYKALDTRLGRTVAIKMLARQHLGRFEREARAIAALNHPHICQLYDIGADYLVMEFIAGATLQGPMPVDRSLQYGLQICDALDAAHQKNIIHRDLKPDNIMVTAGGVKVLDFGIAKIELPDHHSAHLGATDERPDTTRTMALTNAGKVFGTASYMSPEQAKGERTDARSDIFSFGLVLYEMLSGRQAFANQSTIETIAAIVRDNPAPLNAPPGVTAIISRCLQKLPPNRFQTMGEVRSALQQAADEYAVALQKPKAAPRYTSSIAVLPFANMSSDKENEYFSDGLAEEILNLLTQIPGLKVIARTSSFAFRGKDQDIRTIAKKLGVGNVLEGSVRRSGNRLRITAQLVQAADGTHLWSERFDREMTDIFAIQDEIGQAISQALQVRLAPRTHSVDIEAYQNYLKGQYHRARYTPDSLAKAKDYFERALAIDPNYAQAYSGLAAFYYLLAGLALNPPSEIAAQATAAAEKALALGMTQLDATQSEAHSVLATMSAGIDYNWPAAELQFRQAISTEPVSPTARLRYVLYFLLPVGRISEAMEQSRLALETDPLAMILHFGMGLSYYLAKQFQEAIEYSHRALEIDSSFYLLWLIIGGSQLGAGRLDQAIASLEKAVQLAPWYSLATGYLAAAHHQAGNHERSNELARKLSDWRANSFGAAIYHAAAGETDAMFAALEEAYRQRDFEVRTLPNLERFDPYRNHPRFQALLQRIRL